MFNITKSMVVVSALVAAGLVAAFDMSGAQDQSPAAQVSNRFPTESEMFAPVSMNDFTQKLIEQQVQADGRKGDRLPIKEECTRQEFPYLSQQCLVSKDGQLVRRVNRIITVERQLGDNTSELVRIPVAELAQR